jgi:hypothetical protein
MCQRDICLEEDFRSEPRLTLFCHLPIPGSTPYAVFVMQLDRADHFGLAVNTVSAAEVSSLREDFLK